MILGPLIKQQDRVVNSSGLEKIYTLTDGRTDIQKSDLYSEVALAKKAIDCYCFGNQLVF